MFADPITFQAHTRQGDQVLTASSDRTARLWNLASGEMLRQYDQHAHTAI